MLSDISKVKQCDFPDDDEFLIHRNIVDLIELVGHSTINKVYNWSRYVRKNFPNITHFPLQRVYKTSLFLKFDSDYKDLSTNEVAKIEEIPLRTAYEYRRQYIAYKKKFKKFAT